MKILLTNHHLADRAGSELYTKELSAALALRGHDVAVFTFVAGAVADEIRAAGVPVFTSTDGERIEAFAPDVVHAQHTPCLYFLTSIDIDPAVVFSSLGVLPALEAPPPLWPGVALGLAVSEEVKAAVEATPFGRSVEVRVLRNWFDDRGLQRPVSPVPRPVRDVVVVTNHLDPRLAAMLDRIAASRPEFRWTHWGCPTQSVTIDPARLASFDAVITIGRTALLAGALGVPCLLFDIHGCDGWLEAARLDELARCNFSGRVTRARPTQLELEGLLFEQSTHLDLGALAAACWQSFSLTERTREAEAAYADALRSGCRLGSAARASYGRLGASLRDSLHIVRYEVEAKGRRDLDTLRAECAALRTEGDALRADRDALRTEGEALRADRDALRAEGDTSRAECATLRGECDALREELQIVRKLAAEARAQADSSEQQLAELRRCMHDLESSFGVRLVRRAKRIPGLHRAYMGMQVARRAMRGR